MKKIIWILENQQIIYVKLKEKKWVSGLLIEIFFNQFVNNFSELLLCKINVGDVFNTDNFSKIFVKSRSTKIFIE